MDGFIDEIRGILALALVLLGPGAIQFLILRLTRNRFRFLRWAMLLAVACPVVLAGLVWASGDWLWPIFALLYLVLAVLIFLGWRLGWWAFSQWEKEQRQKK